VSDPAGIDLMLYPTIAARRDRHVLDRDELAIGIDQRDSTGKARVESQEVAHYSNGSEPREGAFWRMVIRPA
jgi:hypothetical protein